MAAWRAWGLRRDGETDGYVSTVLQDMALAAKAVDELLGRLAGENEAARLGK